MTRLVQATLEPFPKLADIGELRNRHPIQSVQRRRIRGRYSNREW